MQQLYIYIVTDDKVRDAIRSFPAGSSGGPDGFRPQHMLDLVNCRESSSTLVSDLTDFINLLFSGHCPPQVRTLLFGGKLLALNKKDGGLRPIAVGYYWRRLASKCANSYALEKLGSYFGHVQLGVGVPGGCEAAIHAARRFVSDMSRDQVVVKLDFKNAFNSIHRDIMLELVASELPELYHFCHLAYGASTTLQFGDEAIWSAEGVQQGDPLGPLLFCLVLHPILLSLDSPLKIGFMDDVTLGGDIALVADDVERIAIQGASVGLELNHAKCELIHSIPLVEEVVRFWSHLSINLAPPGVRVHWSLSRGGSGNLAIPYHRPRGGMSFGVTSFDRSRYG